MKTYKAVNWVVEIEGHGRMYFSSRREAERTTKEYRREYPHLVVEMYHKVSK